MRFTCICTASDSHPLPLFASSPHPPTLCSQPSLLVLPATLQFCLVSDYNLFKSHSTNKWISYSFSSSSSTSPSVTLAIPVFASSYCNKILKHGHTQIYIISIPWSPSIQLASHQATQNGLISRQFENIPSNVCTLICRHITSSLPLLHKQSRPLNPGTIKWFQLVINDDRYTFIDLPNRGWMATITPPKIFEIKMLSYLIVVDDEVTAAVWGQITVFP